MESGMKTTSITRLITSNLHTAASVSGLQYLINVPITSAGINRMFSSLESTLAEFSGTNFHFEKINPITINVNRNNIWLKIGSNNSMI